LAKIAATIDVLSHGRLELGVGTGWQREEFEAQGLDYGRRGQALTDTVAACRALWSPSPSSFDSATVSFSDIWCEPKPSRPGGPPILFSGTLTPRNVRRIVELGDGWIPIMHETEPGITSGIELLREAMAGVGRDPETLRVRVALPAVRNASGSVDLAASIGQIPGLLKVGATDLVMGMGAYVTADTNSERWIEVAGEQLQAATG